MASGAMAGPSGDSYAESWSALLELFISSAGLKLRMQLVDTVLVKSGRILGHFYTNRDGCVSRFSPHEITRQAVYQRLAGLAVLDPALNPFGYLAVAHFASGVSRLLKRAELQELVASLCGPYEFNDPSSVSPAPDALFCLQAYVVPSKDVRYIAAYDLQEGPTCTVLGRRYSVRYTHALDDPATVAPEHLSDSEEPSISARPVSAWSSRSGAGSDSAPAATTLSAEELLVESQLVAMGLIEARAPGAGGAAAGGRGGHSRGGSVGGEDAYGIVEDAGDDPSPSHSDGVSASLPAPKRIKDDVAKLLQAVASFVERAHGQRIIGLVAEFVVAAGVGPGAGQVALTAVHAVQLDHRGSRGRLGTFTERWTDYLEGLAPAPAPQAPGRKNQSPSILRSSDQSLVMTERSSGMLVRTAPPAGYGSGGGAFDRLALSTPSGSVGGRQLLSPGSPAGGMGMHCTSNAGGSGNNLTRIYSASPSAAHHRSVAATMGEDGLRPGSAPAEVVKVGRHISNSVHSSANNGHYTLRNAMSAARAGGGGNPTAAPGAPDSYTLWLAREGAPSDSMAARLALEVEALRERLQRQTDIAVRAEAALQQLAVNSGREGGELRQQIEELRVELGRVSEAKRNLSSEYERLRTERAGLQTHRSDLSNEVESLRQQLAAERETLARMVREASGREEGLEGQLKAAREERDEAVGQMNGLRRRLEEESEVVEALRGQLYDYKQVTQQLQTQVRRGRNNKQLLQSAVGLALPNTMASVNNLGTAASVGLSGGGAGGRGDGGGVTANGGGKGDGDHSDGEGEEGKEGERSSTTAETGANAAAAAAQSRQKAQLGGSTSPSTSGAGAAASKPHLASSSTFAFRDDIPLTGPNPFRVSNTVGADPFRSASAPRAAARAAAPSSSPTPPAGELSARAFASLLGDVRGKRNLSGLSSKSLAVERQELPPAASVSGAAAASFSGPGPTAASFSGGSPSGRRSPASTAAAKHSAGHPLAVRVFQGSKKPNYDQLQVHDLFLLSWTREALPPRMLECHAAAIKMVQEHEEVLFNIYSFYGQLGRMVWLDDKLTLNEKQFAKLAAETGVPVGSTEDAREVFRRLSDKTEFGSEASANHPTAFIFFEQFPEGVMRLAALRYEWRPPENLEDAEEELYCAAAPFMPATARPSTSGAAAGAGAALGPGGLGGPSADAEDPPPRPPETVFLQILKTYLKDDLLAKARRNKTAGSSRAKSMANKRTAPNGLWLNSTSQTAGR